MKNAIRRFCRNWNAGSRLSAGRAGHCSAAEFRRDRSAPPSSECFRRMWANSPMPILKTARKFPWFPQLREQLLPSRFRDFEKFLASAGVDPNTQVDELAWAGITATKTTRRRSRGRGARIVRPFVKRSSFQAAEASHDSKCTATTSTPSAAEAARTIFFSCSSTRTRRRLATAPALEKLIDVRTGVTESLLTNDLLFPLINEANGNGIIWGVLDKTTRTWPCSNCCRRPASSRRRARSSIAFAP